MHKTRRTAHQTNYISIYKLNFCVYPILWEKRNELKHLIVLYIYNLFIIRHTDIYIYVNPLSYYMYMSMYILYIVPYYIYNFTLLYEAASCDVGIIWYACRCVYVGRHAFFSLPCSPFEPVIFPYHLYCVTKKNCCCCWSHWLYHALHFIPLIMTYIYISVYYIIETRRLPVTRKSNEKYKGRIMKKKGGASSK